MFFKSMTAYLNAGHDDWAVKNIFNSRCPKTVILAFLKRSGKPFKSQPFLTSGCFCRFSSFTNETYCLTRQKFPTSGRYFDL